MAKILVVDDDNTMLSIIAGVLKKSEHDVFTAADDGEREAVSVLMDRLKHLEYRGYASADVASITSSWKNCIEKHNGANTSQEIFHVKIV